MGRAKLKLERLEPGASRNTTYTKRRHGLTKKVSELSILCDIEIMLLTFSPGGRPAFFKSENSSIEEIIQKFAQLSPQERAQRKLESLEVLKKAFKNLEHVINLKDPFGPDYHSAEDLTALAELLRARLSDINYNLSCWIYMDEIESIEQLAQMKDSLEKTLFEIWDCKDIVRRQQLGVQCIDQHNFEEEQLDIECADQFHQGVDFPFDLNIDDQQLQLLSWIQDHHKQNLDLQKDLYLFQHRPKFYRDTECSGAIAFEGYPGVIRTPDQIDMTQTGHEHRFPMDIPNAGHGNGYSMDLINSDHKDDFLLNVGRGHEHGFPVDLYKTRTEDGFLVGLTDSGHGHAILMDFIKTENDTGQQHDSGQEYDISRGLTRSENENAFPMDIIRTGHGEDILMDLINIHREREMPMDFSQTGNEHGISMDLIKFANDHGISMDLVKTENEDGFPVGFIETGDDYGTSMDLRKAGTGDGLPIDMIETGHEHCMSMDHAEAGDQDGISMDMLKDGHEYYITDKTERKENLDMQLYEEHPDQTFSFPLLCDNSFQPQEHLNMLENALLSGIDNISDFHEFDHNLSDGTSGVAAFDEYLYPQLDYSSDDEADYNDHLHFGATGCPIIVT